MEVKTYTQTLEFLRSYIEPVASTAEKAISEALGFVLADDLHSPIDLPLFNNSAMDGWAFGSEDITAPDLFSFSTDIVTSPYFRRESNFFIVGLHNLLFDDGIRSFRYFSAGHNTDAFT